MTLAEASKTTEELFGTYKFNNSYAIFDQNVSTLTGLLANIGFNTNGASPIDFYPTIPTLTQDKLFYLIECNVSSNNFTVLNNAVM